MKTLLLTDLHFHNKPAGLLDAQKECIKSIVRDENPDEVIIMGDLMMHRKPSPTVLLALKDVLEYMSSIYSCRVKILRGNHDSETRSDNGVTALSVFDGSNIEVITHTKVEDHSKRVYIPHYEDEEIIRNFLESVPSGYTVFGHFGYHGCLNSVGDADFTIKLDSFRSPSFLGHIHRFSQNNNVTILGTQYTTNFGECEKTSVYGVLRDGTNVEYTQPTTGPRHLVYDYAELEDNLDFINDPDWFTLLRVLIGSDSEPIPYDKLKVGFLDIKWKPSFDEDMVSSYSPGRSLFTLNEIIIEDYVDSCDTSLSKDKIMEGYKLISDED